MEEKQTVRPDVVLVVLLRLVVVPQQQQQQQHSGAPSWGRIVNESWTRETTWLVVWLVVVGKRPPRQGRSRLVPHNFLWRSPNDQTNNRRSSTGRDPATSALKTCCIYLSLFGTLFKAMVMSDSVSPGIGTQFSHDAFDRRRTIGDERSVKSPSFLDYRYCIFLTFNQRV